MRKVTGLVAARALVVWGAHAVSGQATAPTPSLPGGGPIIVFETSKGSFEVETYPNEAPKTVAHILALVRKDFYNGLRIHRVEPGFVVQWGDPQTRDMTKRELWGTGGSGTAVGVSEVSKTRPHLAGSVGAAFLSDPRAADSQIYVTLSPQPQLNSRYTVLGHVISGMEVVTQLRVTDMIKRASVKETER
jgi:cyclophilin family peptidyl-prolyl cis-trans isomerase